MATATSNNTDNRDGGSVLADQASGITHLLDLVYWLEHIEDDLSEVLSFHTAGGSDVESQRTISQVTVHGPNVRVGSTTLGSSSTGTRAQPVKLGGLAPDNEGRETRREMLQRRRKECSAEDVDVALAPVVKINVPYVFYPEQYKLFRKLFPRVSVDSGLNFTHHDHPVAHTATLVGIRMVQAMIKPGYKVLDLHGNPNMNENFNAFAERKYRKRGGFATQPKIHTLVEMKTAADAVRKVTKWGPEWGEDGERRWKQMSLQDVPSGYYDMFVSVHTLYYYNPRKVCELMANNPNAKLVALVNYEKTQSGLLYGELKYNKQNGRTVQTSPNGEKYEHADIDYWFQQSSYRSPTGSLPSGIAWTISQVGGPLYAITITSCPKELADCEAYEPPLAPTLTVAKGGKVLNVIKVGGVDVKLRITNADFAAELRAFMTFRNRADPQTFKDLCVKARKLTGPDLIHGSRQYSVDEGDVQDHIAYAYLVDSAGELDLLNGISLLKRGILDDHAKGLVFDGNGGQQTFIRNVFQWLIGRKDIKQALGARSADKNHQGLLKPIFDPQPRNTGGLLPLART